VSFRNLPFFSFASWVISMSKEEQLYWAALGGDLEKVKSLCSDPALNINWQNPKGGFTPLFLACQARHLGW